MVLTMTEPQPKVTTFRLDPEIRVRIDAYAQRTRRSLNGAVNFLLGQALDEAEKEQENPPEK